MKKILSLMLVLSTLMMPALPALADVTVVRPDYLDCMPTATFADPALIPYPENRGEDGYLPEGEFLYEDAENGLWAYLSATVQVEIIRFRQRDPAQQFFVTDVRFKPEAEQLKQHTYVNATMREQLIYPQTLAQTSKMVLAINSDFYLYRKQNKQVLGNIIRDGKVISNLDRKRGDSFPNLDTMALHDDGRMTVYSANEVTADEILAQGDVHDALSFGPWLIRDGELRNYKGKNYDHKEPRTAIGMVEPGHYVILTVEAGCDGKKVGDGITAKGFTVTEVGRVLYAYGCEQGFMLDGGSTAVLIFMGEKLNRTGNMSTGKLSTPRNQHELFGVGTSELVHTDWYNGKPKK